MIERNGKSLLELINSILDISRIEAGREEINITEFSMKELILEMISILRPQADQKGIKLLMAPKTPEIKMISDAAKCRHILQNMIGNAVKFTQKGSVKIVLAREGEMARIKVTDTGVGIAPEQLPHIFEEFRQADAGTARPLRRNRAGTFHSEEIHANAGRHDDCEQPCRKRICV